MATAMFVVLGIYLLIVMAIGIARGRGSNTSLSYLLADRKMGYIPTGLSIFATMLTGSMILGTTGLFYSGGALLTGYGYGYLVGFPIVYYLIGSRLRAVAQEKDYYTIGQYLTDRYNSHIFKFPAGILGVIFMAPYMAVGAVAVGIVFEANVGMPYSYGVFLFYLVLVVYVGFGGLRSVMYTDVLQGIIGVGFYVVAVIFFLSKVGGPIAALSTGSPVEALQPHQAIPFYCWIFFLAVHPLILPDRQMRIFSLASEKELRKAVIFTTAILALGVWSLYYLGGAFRILIPGIEATDTVFAVAIGQYIPILLPLFLVAVWAASMSTVDSQTVAVTALIKSDIMYPFKAVKQFAENPKRVMLINRSLVIFLLLLSSIFAIIRPAFLWDAVLASGYFFMQLLPGMVGGLYLKKQNKLGAELGFIIGVIITIVFIYGKIPGPFGIWPGVFGFIVNSIVYAIGYFVSSVPYADYKTQEEIIEKGTKLVS